MILKFLSTLIFCALVAKGVELKPLDPKRWSLQLVTNGSARGMIYLLDINCYPGVETEIVLKERTAIHGPDVPKKLFVGRLSDEETTSVRNAFVKAMQTFVLEEEQPQVLDGRFVSVELTVGDGSLRLTYSNLERINDVPTSIRSIINLLVRCRKASLEEPP